MTTEEEVPPMPEVGDRIRKFYTEGNPNNWLRFGVVRGIVDDQLIVRRWLPKKQRVIYEIVSDIEWEYSHARFIVVKKRAGKKRGS